MPDSYAQLTAGKPVLSYATPPLERDLRVWGPASLTLHAASSAIDTVWFVKVLDVPPSGPPQLATRGILKASFREIDPARSRPGQPFHPFRRQELLEPNRIYEFQIELSPLCRTFKQGHRIELQIASEDIHYTNFLRQIDVQLLPWPVENEIHHEPCPSVSAPAPDHPRCAGNPPCRAASRAGRLASRTRFVAPAYRRIPAAGLSPAFDLGAVASTLRRITPP